MNILVAMLITMVTAIAVVIILLVWRDVTNENQKK